MSKQRHYYYIEGFDPANPSKVKYTERPIESDDTFEDDLIMLAFPLDMLKNVSSVLSAFNLRDDSEYFFNECREVVSVPEKHVNEKGEGKLTFQSYFHKFPDSVTPFFEDLIAVVMIHPREKKDGNYRDYNMIGYINVNKIEFKDHQGNIHPGYYYNVLRMSEATVGGEAIYRRKKLFSCMFSVLLDLVTVNDVHFVYANMGRENQGILDALHKNTERNGKFYETFPMRNNTHVNFVMGSKSAEKKLVDISHDKARLKEYYQMIHDLRGNYMFNQYFTEEKFFNLIDRILGSSSTSKVYMIPDENNKIAAAGFFVNWADYLYVKLQNPKGFFKLIDSLQITDRILLATQLVGEPAQTRQLLKGATQYFKSKHKVKVTLLNGHDGDKHFEVKKSVIYDPFLYFVIYDRPELYAALKEHSKDEHGNIRLFVDTPML